MTKKQRKVLRQLVQACCEPDSYSVTTMCSKIGTSCEEIMAWAQKDSQCAMALQFCHESCLINFVN